MQNLSNTGNFTSVYGIHMQKGLRDIPLSIKELICAMLIRIYIKQNTCSVHGGFEKKGKGCAEKRIVIGNDVLFAHW